jgi:hypothetical protein
MVTGQISVGTTKVQFPPLQVQPQFMTVINAGGTGTINVGDKTVDATLNGVQNGVALGPGSSFTFQLGQDYSTRMSEWWAINSASGGTLNYILI